MQFSKYILSFIITVSIFGAAFLLSDYLSNKKIENIKSIEQRISLDILSSETQFDLLREVQCSDVNASILSGEIGTLGDRLTRLESERGIADSETLYLKQYYSLLQIKDYLLSKRLSETCGSKNVFLIYLYGNKANCPTCENQGYVLTEVRKNYPDLRVYSFDVELELSAIKTLLSVYKVENTLPALIIQGKPYYGFKSLDELDALLPQSLRATSTTATSTATTTKRK
ncbi:MAG: hypothetical protein WAV09_01335 [Minisyncoccia bacterium]